MDRKHFGPGNVQINNNRSLVTASAEGQVRAEIHYKTVDGLLQLGQTNSRGLPLKYKTYNIILLIFNLCRIYSQADSWMQFFLETEKILNGYPLC